MRQSRTMLVLDGDPEAQALTFARSWFEFAAQNQWSEALRMLDASSLWSAFSVLQRVALTFDEGSRFHRRFGRPVFSSPTTAKGVERHRFGRASDGSYWLDYDVPLNGEFSDLTAQFEFHARGGGFTAVLLDLHVL